MTTTKKRGGGRRGEIDMKGRRKVIERYGVLFFIWN